MIALDLFIPTIILALALVAQAVVAKLRWDVFNAIHSYKTRKPVAFDIVYLPLETAVCWQPAMFERLCYDIRKRYGTVICLRGSTATIAAIMDCFVRAGCGVQLGSSVTMYNVPLLSDLTAPDGLLFITRG